MTRLERHSRKAPAAAENGRAPPSSASTTDARAPASALLALQRSAGNELTGRMIGGLPGQARPRDAEPDLERPAATAEAAVELVIDDSAATAGPRLMKRSGFFARLRAEVCAAVESGLAGSERSVQGCPLIERWIGHYEAQDTERINRDLPRFAGDGPRPDSADGYITLITSLVRTSVDTWARTGRVTGLPPGLPLPGMALPGLGTLGGLGGTGGVLFKARPGGPRGAAHPRELQARLGGGHPLDGGVRARMESAFGRSFSQVRLHTDGGAAELASRLDARAFTIGDHVAFGAREYRPGTLAGDALLAHELAHVAQQAGAGEEAGRAGGLDHGGVDPGELERDADLAAAGAIAALGGGRLGSHLHPPPRRASPLRLQRCRRETAEERQLEATDVPSRIIAASGFGRFLPAFETALAAARDLAAARRVVADHGHQLWEAATGRAQAATGASTDDRPLYWTRLQMTRALRRWSPGFRLSDADRDALVQRFERASRGMDAEMAAFPAGTGEKRILISGFDPFGLDQHAPRPPSGDPHASRGNPSGAAVLALDGTSLTGGGVTGDVEGVIFPVRFADFDAGMVESFFGPYLATPNAVDMVMTISQGGAETEVERFAGRRRSADASDNLGAFGGGTRRAPVEPAGVAPGPEFLESGLEERPPGAPLSPADRIRSELGRSAPLAAETEFEQLPPAAPGATRPSAGATAVAGSGGGYLSNEIFYRTSLLRRRNNSTIPLGHLHVRALRPEVRYSTASAFAAARDAIVETVKRILRAVLPGL